MALATCLQELLFSSSSSDEDISHLVNLENKVSSGPSYRMKRFINILHFFTNVEFRKHFRIPKNTANHLIEKYNQSKFYVKQANRKQLNDPPFFHRIQNSVTEKKGVHWEVMAAAAGSYKRIIELLEKWPIDKNKIGGRDLGEYLRNYINKAYKDNKFEQNLKYWDQQYLSLQKLVNSDHKNKYRRSLSSSATGLTAQQCNIALSNEFLEELEAEEQSIFRKLFSLRPDRGKK